MFITLIETRSTKQASKNDIFAAKLALLLIIIKKNKQVAQFNKGAQGQRTVHHDGHEATTLLGYLRGVIEASMGAVRCNRGSRPGELLAERLPLGEAH